ncbi:penicillin-binding protein 2 [Patescibacteria group bacterium]|nr:penicillin-binding protein 2 [Patescibacteria group bacterium]
MFGFHLLKKVKNKKDIEPQEVFLDSLAQKKEAELGISEKKFEVPLSKKILKGFLIFAVVLLFILFVKTFQFQVLENKKFSALANENKFIIHSIRAARGVIYDSKGEQLVFNKPSFDLILDKRKLPSSDFEKIKVLKEVSEIVEENLEDLEKKINEEQNREVLISKDLDHQTLILLETKIAELSGFRIERNSIRYYIEDLSFAHLIGYTGKISAKELEKNPGIYSVFDYVGRDGLEKSYEETLRKNPGKTRIERDVYGNLLSKEIISLPESGKSLILWLDSELEKKIEEELKRILKDIGAEKAVGVALNPKTGGVLALVSIPSYNNNLFSKGADQEALSNLLADPREPLFNLAVSGLYPTGSTIKPLVASAALEEEIISPSKKINCKGGIAIPHRYEPEVTTVKQDWRIHGWTDMRKAIAESCNVYFYTVGGGYKDQEGLGPSRIKKYLELFGWGDKTEIDLSGEVKGLIPFPEWKKEVKKEPWWDGDTYNLSIGQGDIKVTPLQVANAFAAIANGGTLYKPKVVKEIVDSEKNLIEEIKSEILKEDFINPENLEIVRQGMRRAVTGENSPYASSVLLNSLPVSAAAKTGTAQTPRPSYYHNWITVFAPYDDPQIVLTIMVENVKDVQAVALPVAKEILKWYFSK